MQLESIEAAFLETQFLGNTVRAWLAALIATIVFYVVARFLIFGASRRIARTASKTRNHWDDIVSKAMETTKSFLIFVVSLFVGSRFLDLPERWHGISQSVAVIALIVQGGLWFSGGMSEWLAQRTRLRAEEDPAEVMTMNVLGLAAKIGLWSIVVLLALDNLGIDVTALVAGLGIGGVAVALAAQNILGDLFASLSIVFDKPFVLGDFVTVGDFLGTVEAIGLKTTRIRSLSGEQVVFSNTDLLTSRIRNYGRMYERRVVLKIGVTYQTPREQLRQIPGLIRAAIEAHGDKVRFDRSHLASYSDFAIAFESVYYVHSPDFGTHMDIQQDVLLEIHGAFEERDIDFAYPTQTLFMEQGGIPRRTGGGADSDDPPADEIDSDADATAEAGA